MADFSPKKNLAKVVQHFYIKNFMGLEKKTSPPLKLVDQFNQDLVYATLRCYLGVIINIPPISNSPIL